MTDDELEERRGACRHSMNESPGGNSLPAALVAPECCPAASGTMEIVRFSHHLRLDPSLRHTMVHPCTPIQLPACLAR